MQDALAVLRSNGAMLFTEEEPDGWGERREGKEGETGMTAAVGTQAIRAGCLTIEQIRLS